MIDDALTTIAFLVGFLAVLGAVEGVRIFLDKLERDLRRKRQ